MSNEDFEEETQGSNVAPEQSETTATIGVAAATGVTPEEQSQMNKTAEEQALEEAAAASNSVVSPEPIESELSSDVFFDGRKVVEILPREMQNQPHFVHCRMSDGTTVHVPEGLFAEGDLSDLRDESTEAEVE